jgi:hypothetical protein
MGTKGFVLCLAAACLLAQSNQGKITGATETDDVHRGGTSGADGHR